MIRMLLRAIAVLIVIIMAPQPIMAQNLKVVIAQATDAFIFLPAYVARAKGYFAEEGIDGSVTIYRGGVEALSSVIAESSDIYLGPPSTAMKAIVKGQDLKVWGAVLSQVPSNIVLQGDIAKSKGLTLSSPMDVRIKSLRGLTIGINAPGSGTDQVLRYTARLAGLEPDRDFKIVPVGGDSALIASFEQRRIDGFTWPSPASDIAVKKFGGMTIADFAKGEYEPLRDFLYVSLISRTEWLKQNPDRAARVVRAFTKAQKLINDKPDEARAALRGFFKDMDEDAFNDGFKANAVAVPSSLRVMDKSVALNKTFSEAVENIKLNLDIRNVYTNEYVDLAEKAK